MNDFAMEKKMVGAVAYADLNHSCACFGTFSPTTNILGVTLEYRLPFQDAILEETVMLAAEKLISGASYALFNTEMSFKKNNKLTELKAMREKRNLAK